jgi:DNA repair protein RecN (Recombination protein N)
MSRFMLAIKSLIAQKIELATMIFDEIDTGVSGLVANKVATVLDKLAKGHQIIAITHLPQIASRGSHHINVYKSTENKVTTTHLKLLHQADREIEIARMISGESITPASLASARELLG